MTGLVLEGGGTKGSYQIGAYYALKDCHIKIDGVVGTSIGSFNAAMISAGKESELLNFWRNEDTGEIMGLDDNYIKSVNENKSKIEQLYYSSQDLKKILRNKGMSTSGLHKVLYKYLSEDEIRKAKKDFGLVTVRLNSLQPQCLFKENIPKGKLLDYILASCYFPTFKPEKMIDGSYYMDGGFYDNSPSNMLVKKGYDKIYVISLKGIGLKRKKIAEEKLTYITPSRDLGSTLNVNHQQIVDNITLGYYDTIKTVKGLDGYKYIFKPHPSLYYERMLRHFSKEELEHFQNYFFTTDNKKMILLCIEEILKLEHAKYNKIYDPFWEIIRIKNSKRKYVIYQFIKKLNLF